MWQESVQGPTHCCAQTGRTLRPGESYFAVLRDTPTGLIRADYAADSWHGPPDDSFSFWKARVPQPNRPKQPQVDNEAALQCFLNLENNSDVTKQQFRYILGLLLARRRVLKLVEIDTVPDGEFLVLQSSRAGSRYRVRNPNVSADQLAAIEEQVAAFLRH